MKLIDKTALVAEIEKLKGKVSDSSSYCNGWQQALRMLELSIDTMQEEPVSIWHDASKEPNDKSSCLIHYIVGGKVSYRDIFPVLYNKKAREFVSEPYPHPTGYKVEQSSLEGGVVAEVYKNMRDRFPLSDIYKWAYTDDIIKLSNVERTVKDWKDAQGDDLPEYDREVIAILDYDFGHYKVVYAHRPNPNGWNGTNIDTGEKEHFEPVIYDKGGWNQPHVLYWLDAKLPYEEK